MLFMLLIPTEEKEEKTQIINTTLEELLSQIAKEDTSALEELYLQTKSAVYSFAMSFLKNRYTAEDVMQDTYLIIYSKASSYRALGKPMAWILTIVRNLCLMKLRGKKPQELDENMLVSDNFTGNSEDKIILETVLKILTEEERQVVMLYCIAGLKHREIADFLDKPLGTILSKYKRALSKMQNHLKEEA